jgi:monoamine oxidase
MIGPLAFASSGIASEDAGYFEGAMHSGLGAADEIARFLGELNAARPSTA